MKRMMRIVPLVLLAGGGIFLFNLVASPGAPPAPAWVGMKKCKKCHIKQYKTWADTKHAKAFEVLKEKYQKDAECLKCHTTGMGQGGFVSAEETPQFEGVQCEQCHGPGGDHIPLMTKLKKDKTPKDQYPKDKHINRTPSGCTRCHNPHKKHKPVE